LTALSHLLDVTLVAGRGRQGAQLPVTVDEHLSSTYRHAVDAGDERPVLALRLAQSHRVRFMGHSGVAQIDIAIPAGQVAAGIEAQRYVATAGAIIECLVPHCGVGLAGSVLIKCIEAAGGVVAAGGVALEGEGASGGIAIPGSGLGERKAASGGV